MENVTPNLADLGIDLTTFNIQNYSDKNGVIQDLGIENTEKIKKEASIAAAKAKAEVAIAQAEADKAANDAKVAAATEIARKQTEFAVKKADIMAQSEYKRDEKLTQLKQYELLYESILKEKQCLSIKELAVTGSDLIALGMQPGKNIGETLNQLLELVLEHPEWNTKEKLLELQKEINEKMAEGVEMSQYDLEYMQKKYDLELAKIALEEA